MIHVLIVEDDYRIGDIHAQFLNKLDGFHVAGKALNGKEALQIIKQNKEIDLILLDIYMPDILGTEIMSEIRKANLKIDIIIISAAIEKEIIEEVIRFGAFDYIIKPVKMKRFLETLNRYKQVKSELKGNKTINQKFLDHYFGYDKRESIIDNATPKGIDPITLKKIKDTINKHPLGLTAEEMGNEIGTSRTTARRYLEYLISKGKLTAELEYGAVGRPERKYFS